LEGGARLVRSDAEFGASQLLADGGQILFQALAAVGLVCGGHFEQGEQASFEELEALWIVIGCGGVLIGKFMASSTCGGRAGSGGGALTGKRPRR